MALASQDSASTEQGRWIAQRLDQIQSQIPGSVQLVAVTKTFPADIVRLAYGLGLREFGESKVQEALEKQQQLTDLPDIVWHFIGRLQSNKSRKVIEHFDWIHSVDSLKLAQRLDRQSGELSRNPQCCLQVKLRPDPNKGGFEVDELKMALPELAQLEQLTIRGLMVIPPLGLTEEETRSLFAEAASLADDIRTLCQRHGWTDLRIETLSMGMSGDFESAIAAGSTLVRIGSGLFGHR